LNYTSELMIEQLASCCNRCCSY